MKERPIIFSSPMVRAILDGSKTQTRRVVKDDQSFSCLTGDCPHEQQSGCDNWMSHQSPYGFPGDCLWVREAWGYLGCCTGCYNEMHVRYHADDSRVNVPCDSSEQVIQRALPQNIKRPANYELLSPDEKENWRTESLYKWWKAKRSIPSIHMPRWASRITLEITGVRVERLRSISEADSYAEGVTIPSHHAFASNGNPELRNEARTAYQELWESINGPGSWDANPFVWVLDFRKVHP